MNNEETKNNKKVEIVKRYAFIDVQNTESTTNQLLGFVIDWHKMYKYLKKKWNCEKIFFYSGVQNGAKKIKTAPRYFTSRLSSKLRDLVAEKRNKVFFIDINDWKMQIKKDV